MIQVNEILNLSLFKKFNVLCGKEYLSNTVNTAVILEYESSRINYRGYGYGYFVLVSYFFAQTNPELVNNSIKTLISKHVSGLAIKIHPDEHLPTDIIKAAIENHVPILTFYDEFMEDLIININESLKTRAQFIIMEQKLTSILSGTKDYEEIERTALEINPEFKKFIISAALISKEETSNLQVHTYFDNLMYHRSKIELEKPYSFVKLGMNIVLLLSFNEEELKSLHTISLIKSTLSENGFSPDSFYIGYSREASALGEMNKSVERAISAAQVCHYQKTDFLEYLSVGVYKYALAIINNPILSEEIEKKMNILSEYDKIHESNLIKTLVSFVTNNGDYIAASKECFQHTNTIRYRIKKAEQLLDMEEKTADEEITLLIRSYLMQKTLNP